MNYRLKRFTETTIPLIIGFGLVTVAATGLYGYVGGLLSIVFFAMVDVVMLKKQ